MITISVWRSFEWRTLTLRWHASCADPGLTPQVAIGKAASVLAESYLTVNVTPDKDALHFRRSWFNARTILTRGPSGSSWLGWLLTGTVAASEGEGKVTVEASGSVALLFLLPALICALVWFKYRLAILFVAGAMLLLMAIAYVATSDTLQTLATDSLKRRTP